MADIQILRGSLLEQNVEAVVNASATAMRGGGGIDGAIHRAAGPGLLLELCRLAPNGCPAGEVVVTGGHELPFRYILHTPGPRWQGGERGEAELLASCYRNCVKSADSLGIRTLAFCSISTGIYGFPVDRAAPIALATVRQTQNRLKTVVFAMYGAREYQAFVDANRGTR